MQISQRQAFDKIEGLHEILLSLAGKASDYVRPDRRVRHQLYNLFDALTIIGGGVASAHPRKDCILTSLQR